MKEVFGEILSKREEGVLSGKKEYELAIMELFREIYADDFYQILEKALEAREQLGSGARGDVFSIPDSGFCLKKCGFKGEEEGDISVADEYDFQMRASSAGARVPEILTYISRKQIDITSEKERADYIIMEEIKGFSLEDLEKDKTLADRLPANFSVERFLEILENNLDRLHDRGIQHGDLHHGNVMIEERTGMPVIIDFGRAYYEQQSLLGSDVNVSDSVNFETIRSLMYRLFPQKTEKVETRVFQRRQGQGVVRVVGRAKKGPLY